MRGMKFLSALRMELKEKDKNASPGRRQSSPRDQTRTDSLHYGQMRDQSPTRWRHFADSFKRDPNASISRSISVAPDERVYDVESAAERIAASPLVRKLKGRHLQMLAIGGSIGTGLFVGSGSDLATGGPASVLIAFGLIGIMLYCTMNALGELAVLFPIAGSFSAYSTRFIDPAWGFAMGWK